MILRFRGWAEMELMAVLLGTGSLELKRQSEGSESQGAVHPCHCFGGGRVPKTMINSGSASLGKKCLLKVRLSNTICRWPLKRLSLWKHEICFLEELSQSTSSLVGPSNCYHILLQNNGYYHDHLPFQEKAYKTCAKASWNITFLSAVPKPCTTDCLNSFFLPY